MKNKIGTLHIALIISIIINFVILAASYYIGKRVYYYQSGLPQNRKDILPQKTGYITYRINIKQSNANAVNLFKALPHSNSDIVFLGTSLTAGFPLSEMFADCRLKNRGIGGNKTNDIFNRLNEVTNGKPAKIFLEVGTNDITLNCLIDTIFNNFVKIVTTIKKNSPKTRLYVQSVLPFGRNNISNIENYNKNVQNYCTENKITFINLYPLFLEKGSIKDELTVDGTHLNIKGYLIWKDAIAPYIN
ncbi:MAG: GDSL-type esterase/lipase family protein [Bacteroidota bacterium]|nr:GDSL-type esterase/lipase family protein [Bacteroidota bacterium]